MSRTVHRKAFPAGRPTCGQAHQSPGRVLVKRVSHLNHKIVPGRVFCLPAPVSPTLPWLVIYHENNTVLTGLSQTPARVKGHCLHSSSVILASGLRDWPGDQNICPLANGYRATINHLVPLGSQIVYLFRGAKSVMETSATFSVHALASHCTILTGPAGHYH